jgi:hypothetical protein
MAIIQCIPTSCKVELLQGAHDLEFDAIYIALYSNSANLGPDTTVYTTAGEVTGTGYTAGGKLLTGQTLQNSNGSAWIDWDNPSWPGASFYASGAMLYNASAGNKAIMILNFGSSRLFTPTGNTVQFPIGDAYNALMRLT